MNRFAVAAAALLLLALPASAAGALSTPHSGWQWGSPEPQGNDLAAVELQGASGYAAGRAGTVLATGDGGTTWTTLRTGDTTHLDFSRLDMISSQSLVVGSACALRRTDDAGATFRPLPFTTSERRCARRLLALSFPTSAVGYLLFEDTGILKTTDGGESFSSLTSVPAGTAGRPTALVFASDDVGLLATEGGEIFRTTDGGATWDRRYESDARLYGLFLSGATAVAVGDAGTFVVSDDSGDTWTRTSEPPRAPTPAEPNPPVPPDFRSVRCSPAGACLVITNDAAVLRTTDAGRTFQRVEGLFPLALDFASATRAVAVGVGGRTWVSDDGGSSFAALGERLPDTVAVTRIRTTSASVAQVAGFPRALARTTDGGETWRAVGVPTGEEVRDVAFPTPDLGYALDRAGGLYRTRNAGKSWSVLDVDPPAPPEALFAPNGSVVILVGPRGMLRSTDAGAHFSRLRHPVVRVRTLTNIDRAGRALLAFGPRVIAVSQDTGRTWRRIVRPTQKAEVWDADFVSARTGYVLETDGRFHRTDDAGKSWTEVVSLGYTTGRQVDFSDGRHGWLTLSETPGTVLRTSDAGASWAPQTVPGGGEPIVAAPSANVGFLATGGLGDAGLFFTRSGGNFGDPSALTLSTRERVIKRARTVELNGRLTPAGGGEAIEVRYRSLSGRRWHAIRTTTDRGGRFSVARRVTGSTLFVAQWRGDPNSAADGTRPLLVRLDRSG